MRILAAVAFALASCAFAQGPAAKPPAAAAPAGKSALTKATLERYLRKVELWPPQVSVSIGDPKPFIRGLFEVKVHLSAGAATKDFLVYVSADGKTIFRGAVYNVDQNPFQADLRELTTEHQPSFGPANAPMTLILFSDFECPVCREEAKQLREKAPAEAGNELRVVYTDFPLESIHPWAKTAAIAGRCAYRQGAGAFWDYHDWMYEHQADINANNLRAKLGEWARLKKIDAAQFEKCVETRATEGEVDVEIARGKKLQVDSTPTSFLNGRRLVGGVPWQNLIQIIRLELEIDKTFK